MCRCTRTVLPVVLFLFLTSPWRAGTAATTHHTASSAAHHAWKAQLHEAKLVHAKDVASGPGPVPAHFGSLSPQARLAYLLARYEVDPARFLHFHPKLGPYLATDVRLRAATPSASSGLNGLFADTPLTRYLHYRRNLDPTRFDYYHPALGALLAEDDRLKAIQAGLVAGELISPPTITPITSTTSPTGVPSPSTPTGGIGTTGGESTGGGGITPNSVPEPTSLTLLFLGSLAVGSPRIRRWMQSRRQAIS